MKSYMISYLHSNVNGFKKARAKRLVITAVIFLMISGNAFSQLTATITGSASVCQGINTDITFTGLNGTAPYTFGYNLNGGSTLTVSTNGTDASVTVPVPTGTAGTYMYNLLNVTDNTGTSVDVTGTATVVVSAPAVATFSYLTTPYCSNEANPVPTFSEGGIAGTFSSTVGLFFVNSLTGQVNLAGSTPGTYTVVNTIAASGGCGIITASSQIVITALPVAAFSYTTNPYCSSESNPTPTFSAGGVAGTFSSSAGLVFMNASTGQVDLTASTPGSYTVTNTISASGGCGSVTANSNITITKAPLATITYSGSPWCGAAGLQNVTLTGTTGGTFSSVPSGLSINSSTGTINPAASSAGSFTVIYSMPATGGCGTSTAAFPVAISPTPTAPLIGTTTQPTCLTSTGSVVINGLPASGMWTLTRTPAAGVPTTGTGTTTNVSALPAGSYTFTVTNSSGCTSPVSANVVINPQPESPAIPVQSIDCAGGFNHAKVSVTSPLGADLDYSIDNINGPFQPDPVFNNIANGSHYLVVKNSLGCVSSGPTFAVSCGCINPPTVSLSSNAGSTCGVNAVTVTGNTFAGSATGVTITSNGAGLLDLVSSAVTPFSFTYTPAPDDGGKIILITVTTDNPLGLPCAHGVATYSLTVNATPSAPAIGTITNLTCSLSTGSVVLNGLPATGVWTLVRTPGSIIINGNGTSTTVSGLVPGTYTFTVGTNGCVSLPSADVIISPQPSAPPAPVIGAITQPTCATSTGSVSLSGLPETGTWILTRNPGGITNSGTGTSTIVSPLPSGTYTFTATTSTGCISAPSENVVINVQPSIPAAPAVGAITPPGCTLSTGSVVLSGLPATGTWTLIRYPGTVSTTGTGTSTTISGLSFGTYNFTVTTEDGCLSSASANVVVPAQPPVPTAPVIGTITQPTLAVPSGSVALNGLPSSGTWTITRTPGAVLTTGTGVSRTISNLPGGVFTFTVTNSLGCNSPQSAPVTISSPGKPDLLITAPQAVCSPATINLTSPSITEGSTSGLIFTYWKDENATVPYTTPDAATSGTYYIKGATVMGFFDIKPVVVTIDQMPLPNAGADQILVYQESTVLDASLATNETGVWSLYSGALEFDNITDPKSGVTGIAQGENILLWTVQNGVCPAATDTVSIFEHELIVPTLITPNMDGRNDYFILRGLENLGRTEIVIFDRKGARVYSNSNYDNSWNGVDRNKKPLPDDTYFYVIKTEIGKSISGYIVIRH